MGKLNRRTIKPKIPRQELINLSDENHCFVCDRKFDKKEFNHRLSIGQNSIGKNLYRHKKCTPLSDKWTKKFGVSIITV